MAALGKPPPPWLFALTGVPYGVGGAFVGQLMPYFAEQAGIHLKDIGWFTMLLFVPTWLQFLYAPVVDIGMSRRYWLIFVASLAAGCFAVAAVIPLPGGLVPFLILAFIGQMLSGLVGSCNGGLMATLIPDDQRGAAGAAYNIGNLSGGALSAGLIILLTWLRAPKGAIALAMVTMMIGPSIAILAIVETPFVPQAGVFRRMLKDVGGVLLTKSGITGILLCLSPVGTAALGNAFTGMTKPYGASGWVVSVLNGPGNALLTAVGAFIGGWLCDRYSRRAMYLASGASTAIVAVVVAFCPHTTTVYVVGVGSYLFVMGFCYSAFTATVLETIGHGDAAAATKYTLFTAAGNAAIAYTDFTNTRFAPTEDKAGNLVSGNIGHVWLSDAVLNIAGVILLGLVFWKLGSWGKRRHPHEVMPNAT
ncbi:MAG TPA: MFS transporter [Kofleriaceae bacterium]|jgi:MFS family permease